MTITQQLVIQREQEQIWQAWLEADHLVKWFSPEAEIEAKVGGKFELYFNPSNKNKMSTKGCKIAQLEPFESFTFQWKGPDPFAEVMNQEERLTEVKVTLQPVANGTNVIVVHTGWYNHETKETQQAIEWHKEAWANMLASLKSYLQPESSKPTESSTGCC
ncbi:SRPBCC family protein [Paenibacillus arenosi]|uniref:SRPBCC domain-containing protein n=1 Tax=Paenibacillus arenosi TaxID=2774142 RepID=A0ABR9AUW3_9BACL|nr:SRPBCC domain-containing protein [Paenibacillus arenosi]MBD8497000.1 SRPBCC domain-containing protein [Paenibacillus arenosi]